MNDFDKIIQDIISVVCNPEAQRPKVALSSNLMKQAADEYIASLQPFELIDEETRRKNFIDGYIQGAKALFPQVDVVIVE